MSSIDARLKALLAQRIVVIDGAMGTMIQARKLQEDDYRGARFKDNPKDLKGALQEAMEFRGPALVNVRISQESARKPQQFRWHS